MRREFGPVVRNEAMLRAKRRCQICGSRNDLEFHHVGNPSDASLFNCQVLCHPCHSNAHRKDRRK